MFYLSEERWPAHDHIPRQNKTQRYTYIIYESNIFISTNPT